MTKYRWQRNLPAGYKQAYFLGNPVNTQINWQAIREQARNKYSPSAQLKLEWIIYYHTIAKKNATSAALNFGITRNTLNKWLKRYKDKRLDGLEEDSRTPHKLRTRQITIEQRIRIKSLRKNIVNMAR